MLWWWSCIVRCASCVLLYHLSILPREVAWSGYRAPVALARVGHGRYRRRYRPWGDRLGAGREVEVQAKGRVQALEVEAGR